MTALRTPELRALTAGFNADVARPIDTDWLSKALAQVINEYQRRSGAKAAAPDG